jgi:uridine kinase
MTLLRSYLVGIAGTSCSGKSLLASHLKDKLPERRPVVVSCDSYYRDLSTLSPSERSSRNFDHPDAIEWELLQRHLDILAGGEEIIQPVYDFSTHTRSAHSARVSPGELIIVEGLFVLHRQEIRRLLHTKVFVTLSESHAIARRLERDVRERGRIQESVLDQYNRTVKPMTEKFVLPSRTFADIIVDGVDPIEKSAVSVIGHIQFTR